MAISAAIFNDNNILKGFDTMIKNFILGIIFTLFLIPSVPAFASDDLSLLSVSGTGSSNSAPDRAVITIGVVTRAASSKSAQEQNARASAAVINALKETGLAENSISTSGYSFRPEYSKNEKERFISGYSAINTLHITIDDLPLVSRIIDTALANGANQISSLQFSLRDTKKLRRASLLAAIKDAREKADIIADGLGKKITGIKNVTENISNAMPFNCDMLKLSRSNAADFSTPVEAAVVSVTAEVHIDFILSH